MKATIDFDERLYRRLKVEAARRGRTVRELVAEGVRYVLDMPPDQRVAANAPDEASEWRPEWLGSLGRYARGVEDHSMAAVRESVGRERARERARERRK